MIPSLPSGQAPRTRSDWTRTRVVVQALNIARMLSDGRWRTLRELAAEIGVDPRTIRRTIYALERAGVDIERAERDCRTLEYRLTPTAWAAALYRPVDLEVAGEESARVSA